jgi:hypothetical protein
MRVGNLRKAATTSGRTAMKGESRWRIVLVLLVAPVLAVIYNGFAWAVGMNLGGLTWYLCSLPLVVGYALVASWQVLEPKEASNG